MTYRDEINTIVAKRRQAALDAAFALFSAHSIEAVSMNDIARAADMGVATLYRYFGSKLKLCVELGARKWREFDDKVQALYVEKGIAEKDSFEEFSFSLDCFLYHFHSCKPMMYYVTNLNLYVMHVQASPEDLAPYFDSLGRFFRRFTKMMEKARRDGRIRTDIPEPVLYFCVRNAMSNVAERLSLEQQFFIDDPEAYNSVLQLQKQVLLNYMKTEPASPDPA